MYRPVRLLRSILTVNRAARPPHTIITRKMSLLPRSYYTSSSFTPLFRLLDDFDSYNRQSDNGVYGKLNPKFDVKELRDSYHLSGELPGVERNNIEMEFTDPQTLIIRGHSEQEYTSDTPAEGVEKPSTARKGAATENAGTAVARQEKGQQVSEKSWVSERTYGEFSRSFSFPTPVDQDHVQASLKNGVLNVTIPKTRNAEGRKKITIS